MQYTCGVFQVADGLRMITEKLRIEARKSKAPELFLQQRMLDFEYDMYFDEHKILRSIEKLTEEIESNPQFLNQEKNFNYASTFKAVDVEGLGPCDAGFPVYVERSVPVVVAIKGSAKAEKEQDQLIPTELKAKLMPVINVKFEANLGVISPFTSEFIGTGIDMAMHLTLPLDMSLKLKETNQVTFSMKVPEQITREFEAIHVYVKPFTVKKSLHKIQPVSKASDIKTIYSGEPLKKVSNECISPHKKSMHKYFQWPFSDGQGDWSSFGALRPVEVRVRQQVRRPVLLLAEDPRAQLHLPRQLLLPRLVFEDVLYQDPFQPSAVPDQGTVSVPQLG